MNLRDRYVVWTFVRVFLSALLVFSLSAVALDFFSRAGHFVKGQRVAGTFAEDWSRLRVIATFYVVYLPYVLKQVLPFVTLAAGLFTLSAMMRSNEVMVVTVGGTSARRLVLPLFFCGLAVAGGHLAFQEFAVPSLNRRHIALKRFFSGDHKSVVDKLPHLRDGRGTVTQAHSFSFNDSKLRQVVVQRPWNEVGFERWTAPVLEPAGAAWTAPDGGLVIPAAIGALPRRLPPGADVDIGVTPAEVEALASEQGTAELSFSQVHALARKFPGRRHLRVAFHKQMTQPLGSFVLLLLGIPMLLGAGKRRFLGAGVVIALSALYFTLDIFLTSLGDRGDLAPVVAAWFPIVLIASAGLARLATVRT